MQAVRWHARGDVRVEVLPLPPPPGPGEVQIRVSWCGICGTDLEEWQSGPLFIPVGAPHPVTGARAPLVLGHEFAGVVTAVGEGVTEPVPGHRVAVDTIVYCGTCHWCRRGEVIRCPLLGALGLHADGGLAEICNAPARMCLPVPDSVADDEAALAEPLAVAVRALRRGGLRPGERVAVVGLGAVGLMALQAAIAFGAESVAVIEPLPERRALAMRLGADRHVTADDAAALEADVAIECAGTPAAIETCDPGAAHGRPGRGARHRHPAGHGGPAGPRRRREVHHRLALPRLGRGLPHRARAAWPAVPCRPRRSSATGSRSAPR